MNRRRWFGCGVALALAACGGGKSVKGVEAPDSLQPPASQLLTRRVAAKGVQIYVCTTRKDDPSQTEWVFKAPEAQLYDESGKKFGSHAAGPTWRSDDGSAVVGEVVNRWNGPDPSAVPWLLLKVKSRSGVGQLTAVDYVQRLHTRGGNAAADGCKPQNTGRELRVAYTADYYFYVDGSRG
jgi:Protein of unknown function (DUF3455)